MFSPTKRIFLNQPGFRDRITRGGIVLLIFLVTACNGSSDSSAPFRIDADVNTLSIQEGNPNGIDIPFRLTRDEGFTGDVSLVISGVGPNDSAMISSRFSRTRLSPPDSQSTVNLKLEIGALPIQPQQRDFLLTASDGTSTHSLRISVDVEPIDAPDVYLLIGQSNMVGFGGDGQKDASPGGLDEPNPRIKQLNVTRNSETDVFTSPSSYTDTDSIATGPNYIVQAEDPLHIPINPVTSGKSENYIGMGLSFAKDALPHTTQDIILVPAAWSGSAFCSTSSVSAHWNAENPRNSDLGNTLLFDRAVARTNLALAESNGILRGILWHQGESDADLSIPGCSETYEENLRQIVAALRSNIDIDARGASARGESANVPFVAGTMSMGIDEQGDYSNFYPEKVIIDTVHRSVESLIPHAALSNHDDLVPANGYPCGIQSCIHFGSAAFRVMGGRYYAALIRAAGN